MIVGVSATCSSQLVPKKHHVCVSESAMLAVEGF